MSNQKKNTIKVQDPRTKKYEHIQKNIFQVLADNKDSYFLPGVDTQGNTTYIPAMSTTTLAVPASTVQADVARHFKTGATVSAVSGSGGLTPENFMQAVTETVQAINVANGSSTWLASLIHDLHSQDQIFLTASLLTDLTKARRVNKNDDSAPTAEEKSQTIAALKNNAGALEAVLEAVKKRKVQPQDVTNVMNGLEHTYLSQTTSGGFSFSMKDAKFHASISDTVSEIESLKEDGSPLRMFGRVISFTDTTKAAVTRVSKVHLKKQTPLLYLQCEQGGKLVHERLVYSEAKDLENRRASATKEKRGITVDTGVSATRAVASKEGAEKDARDALRLRKVAIALILKKNPNFAMDILADVSRNPLAEVAKAFNELPPAMRNGLLYSNVVSSDVDELEKIEKKPVV